MAAAAAIQIYAYREAGSAYLQTATKHMTLITVPPDNSDDLELCWQSTTAI